MRLFRLRENVIRLFVLVLLVLSCTFSTVVATELEDEDELPEFDLTVRQEPQESAQDQATISLEEKVEEKISQEAPFAILGSVVPAGTTRQLNWPVELNGLKPDVPVIVAHGAFRGPVVNIEGFVKQSRYIADRRDLNRYFPGDPEGVTPARFAYKLFNNIILKCDALIDLHTGSYYRSNLPQLRADMTNGAVAEIVDKFGALTVLHSAGTDGMLRNASSAAGIPAVTMEIGGPLALDPEDVSFGVNAVNTFLGEVGMIRRTRILSTPQPVFYESKWLIAESSGILLTDVALGSRVKTGEQIARIINPVSNEEKAVKAPFAGKVLGKAQNQFVSAGYIIFRIGIEKTEQEMIKDARQEAEQTAEEAVK